MKMSSVEVGLFRLPGVVFEREALTPEKVEEINTWCAENKCGKQMTDVLWSFKKPTQRDLFILRWSE
jgi:hypothetical protein